MGAAAPAGGGSCAHGFPSPSVAALLFLRGRDADGRLRALIAGRAALRPVLGALASEFAGRRLYHALGWRCLADWAREKLGMGERSVRQWARVWKKLGELPQLREAVAAGAVSWTVARKVVGLASPETEQAVLESVRGRTVRAVEAMLRAVAQEAPEPCEDGDRVAVRLPADRPLVEMWHAACELARRMAGEELPTWACAEAIAAEGASVVCAGDERERPTPPGPAEPAARPRREPAAEREHGLRHRVWRGLGWRPRRGRVPKEIAALSQGLGEVSPREIARRLQAAVAFRQALDFEIGRVLRQVVDRKLYRELGFESFERYVEERLDLAPRSARRLVRLARAEHRALAVANAFRSGELTAFQAEALLRAAAPERWIPRARAVLLRRLEEDLDALPRTDIVFHAPREVAAFFLDVLARAGSLEKLLAHAIRSWVQEGEHFKDHRIFARDGYRCTAPGCRCRRGLERHHIWFRSHGGPEVGWNETALCWFHHHPGVHGGLVGLCGRAPDELIFELGGERYRSGDVKIVFATP